MICVKYNYMDFEKLGRKMIKNSLLSLKVLEAQETDSERRNFNFTGEASIPVVNIGDVHVFACKRSWLILLQCKKTMKLTNHDWPMPLESYSQQHHGKTNQSVYTNQTKYIRLTATFHLTLMMTSGQVVESSVTIINNSPSQDYTHLDDQMTLLNVTPGFKARTVKLWMLFFVWLVCFDERAGGLIIQCEKCILVIW